MTEATTNDRPAPIKRHESLKPLSREHHDGLLLCWKIRQGLSKKIAPERIAKYTRHFFNKNLEPHFYAEEQLLFPMIDRQHDLILQAREDHHRLRHLFLLANPDEKVLDLIQQQLEKHIRFEERQLFQEIQQQASPEALQQIQHVHATVPGEDTWEDAFWEKEEKKEQH